ncbi:MAG: capsular biosynthesis protein [Cyclobacteriaceae bacterium]|nr:capsular biosynthesis protein [Cyclobacteriaceae bacterium HetDA_MAG_MS6]
MLNRLFRRAATIRASVDVHSHLIPKVDDGVSSMQDAINVARSFAELGIRRCVTTPHIYPGAYPNDEQDLLKRGQEVQLEIRKNEIDLDFEVAAEYYLDEELLDKLQRGVPLLTFGNKYLLFETSFMNKPVLFEEVLFEMKSQGYKPVLAHPERYQFVDDSLTLLSTWWEQGIRFQITASSLVGMYGKGPQRIARKLIQMEMISLMGSDLHGPRHLPAFKDAMQNKWYQRAMRLPLLNFDLN